MSVVLHEKVQKILEKAKKNSNKTLTGKPKDKVEVFAFFKNIKKQ